MKKLKILSLGKKNSYMNSEVAKIYGKNESFVCEIVKEIKIDGSFLWYFRLQIL